MITLKNGKHLLRTVMLYGKFSFLNVFMKRLKNTLAVPAGVPSNGSVILIRLVPLYLLFYPTHLSICYVPLLCQALGVLAGEPGIVPVLGEHM